MIKFENDTIVQPLETSWFGFYKPRSDTELLTLKENEISPKTSWD
jgi:palmitoyl-protein thioesterase